MHSKKALIAFGGLAVFSLAWWFSQRGGAVSSFDLPFRELSRECLPEQKRSPAKVLFHYGQREVLMKDVVADTVPTADWDAFIMGDQTRFQLKPFRRGLYGTEELEDADRFSTSSDGRSFHGLIAILVKDECLKPERIETIIGLPQNLRFQKWYSSRSRALSMKEWASQCFDGEGRPSNQFSFYESKGLPETVCEKVTNEYFQEMEVALVQDIVISRSWAIRDRSCIEHIWGTDELWANAFLTNSRLWMNTCDEWVSHRNRTRVWFDALSRFDFSHFSDGTLSKTLSAVASPKPYDDRMTGESVEFAAQDFAGAFDAAHLRCTRMRLMKEFQQGLKSVSERIDDLQSTDVKNELEKMCR